MKSIRFVMAAAVLMFMGQVAIAHPHGNKNVKHQNNQHKRIKQGVHSGQLTHREAATLRKQQAKVRNYKQMAMADGKITHAERRLIKNTQKRASKNIYAQKHDRQVRHR